MSPILDLGAIAERISTLIAGQDAADFSAAAMRLSVSTDALRASVDRPSPHPKLSVLAAIVRHYGVDPCWLLYGDYDSTTHALAAEMGESLTPDDLLTLLEAPRFIKPGEPAEHRPRAQLES